MLDGKEISLPDDGGYRIYDARQKQEVALEPGKVELDHALRLAGAANFDGEDDGIGEAFGVDVSNGTVREIGILQVSTQPRYWMCHRCDAIVTGARGEIYFGETDRIAHLFAFVDCPTGSSDGINRQFPLER